MAADQMMSSPSPWKKSTNFLQWQNVVHLLNWDINVLSWLAFISYEDALHYANYISLYCNVICISAKMLYLLQHVNNLAFARSKIFKRICAKETKLLKFFLTLTGKCCASENNHFNRNLCHFWENFIAGQYLSNP